MHVFLQEAYIKYCICTKGFECVLNDQISWIDCKH